MVSVFIYLFFVIKNPYFNFINHIFKFPVFNPIMFFNPQNKIFSFISLLKIYKIKKTTNKNIFLFNIVIKVSLFKTYVAKNNNNYFLHIKLEKKHIYNNCCKYIYFFVYKIKNKLLYTN